MLFLIFLRDDHFSVSFAAMKEKWSFLELTDASIWEIRYARFKATSCPSVLRRRNSAVSVSVVVAATGHVATHKVAFIMWQPVRKHLVPSPNLHISTFWHLLKKKKKSPQERVETILRIKCFGVSTRFHWDTPKYRYKNKGDGNPANRRELEPSGPHFSSCRICVQLLCTSCPPLFSCRIPYQLTRSVHVLLLLLLLRCFSGPAETVGCSALPPHTVLPNKWVTQPKTAINRQDKSGFVSQVKNKPFVLSFFSLWMYFHLICDRTFCCLIST